MFKKDVIHVSARFFSERCNLDCGPHGSCESGHCICQPGWEGSRCNEKQCDARCKDHGVCSNGTCLCTNGKLMVTWCRNQATLSLTWIPTFSSIYSFYLANAHHLAQCDNALAKERKWVRVSFCCILYGITAEGRQERKTPVSQPSLAGWLAGLMPGKERMNQRTDGLSNWAKLAVELN